MMMRRATAQDVDTILAWRRQLAQWLRTRGSDQWSDPMPRQAVAVTVAAGQTWMACDGAEPMGTITTYAWPDSGHIWVSDAGASAKPLPWRPEDGLNDALYLSKTMVPPQYAGRGLGAEMADWASGRAYAAGATWVRLDAWTTNHALHRYYQRQGFTLVRLATDRLSGACFQRPARPYTGRWKTDGD
jgi:ribosomal protein S18 acetylase RimI-like enzyme